MDNDKIPIKFELTRAERLTEEQRKKDNLPNEGLVVTEHTLSEKEMMQEYRNIIDASRKDLEEGFKLYIKYTIDTVKSVLDKH